MENFLHNNSLFVVLGIALIIWVGIAIYLMIIDRKISRVEKLFEDSISSNLNEKSNI